MLYSIRQLDMGDSKAIQRIIEDAFSAELWCDDWRDRRQFDRYIRDLIGNPNSLALGLYDGDRLIGVSLGRVVHWFEGTQYRIDDLGIASDYQGRGAGTHFLKDIEAFCAANAIKTITLKTNRRAAAYHFYARNAFRECEEDVYFEKTCR